MNLKSRTGEWLRAQPAASTGDARESQSEALKHLQVDAAHRLHMRRLLVARNRELDALREIMMERRQSPSPSSKSKSKGSAATSITRPPGLVDGAQMVSLINELEIKVLSEPMGLTSLRTPKACQLGTAASDHSGSPTNGSSKAHPLDDAALMVAARRWDHAADLLIKALSAGEVTRRTDWALRSAIDLLERSGQTERAATMRAQYFERRGREPGRIVPTRLNAPVAGRLQLCKPLVWKCPARLDAEVCAALRMLMDAGKTGGPLVIDWTAAATVDCTATAELQAVLEQAMKSQSIFVHLALSRLIRTLRKELQHQQFSREAWYLWLTLLNWTGFRHAHHAAAKAYAKRYQEDAPAFRSVRCICQALNIPAAGVAKDLVCAARFQGDLTREHAEELDRLEVRTPMPGRLVMLDFRMLTSLDFFFGADLLNWVIQRHSQGETVGIAYAHPLLAHFLQMLGIQQYAKLQGPLSAGMPK